MQGSCTPAGDGKTAPLNTSLIDNHGRPISYLRLAITDRCNLRCSYCMPEQGIAPSSHQETLSYEELERLVRLFLNCGIEKVRITGGEPFARKGCMSFMERLAGDIGVPQLFLTTNGVETARFLPRLKAIDLRGLNLSLDTLDRQRFIEITRRDQLKSVLSTLHQALELGIPLKVNSVVTEDTTDDEIRLLGELAREFPLSVRFIEKMPFSGEPEATVRIDFRLKDRLDRLFDGLVECKVDGISTARLFNREDFLGTLGIIEGKSRRFCSTCNKIRVTPQGMLKTCLYDNGVLDLKKMVRDGATDRDIGSAINQCLANRYVDGHQTEHSLSRNGGASMASIGG
jgi:cyclic pyranopterin phosphate synthase